MAWLVGQKEILLDLLEVNVRNSILAIENRGNFLERRSLVST